MGNGPHRSFRRITVMRCHNGIPPNRTGISWSQILTARDRNIALVSRFPDARGMMVARVHAMGWQLKNPYHCAPPALFPIRSNSCQRSLGTAREKGRKGRFSAHFRRALRRFARIYNCCRLVEGRLQPSHSVHVLQLVKTNVSSFSPGELLRLLGERSRGCKQGLGCYRSV